MMFTPIALTAKSHSLIRLPLVAVSLLTRRHHFLAAREGLEPPQLFRLNGFQDRGSSNYAYRANYLIYIQYNPDSRFSNWDLRPTRPHHRIVTDLPNRKCLF